ncbi:PrsW family intramembrane metalloprotease [Solirubrobacter ginsenosidimutans]|uniref:PrsW family intramembrane metalloprotease n=1 Tax=Solirubrobacter ginsenosidimutans TaxID=490573 RepID=A0A9X3MV43_9ACTN|nr:PrsW family glutamic-type intramembrane protease [Solirubrobacter ginsenosidimutans]MDA0160418.1 PrsW family intramembrane metalloprotease [Solirubrobacter ginsenosidimutans]
MAIKLTRVARAERTAEPHEHFVHLPTRLWKLLLAGGLVTWLIAAVVTEATNDTILVPTVIIVGSFMVPVTMAAFALSRRREGYLTTEEVVLGFLLAGTLGVVATALLETYLLPSASGTFIAVGWIEEFGKGAVLLVVAHQVHHREPRDGMVLGAVVGAGFAAFESAGYALQVVLENADRISVVAVLEIEAFRAVLAPFGHITWTALIGGALFASSRGGRFHLTHGLVLTIVGVVTLHALWDQSYGWAVMLTRGIVMDVGWQLLWPNAQFWAIPPTGSDLFWFNTIYDVLLAIWSVIGATWVVVAWRRYAAKRDDQPSSLPSGAERSMTA